MNVRVFAPVRAFVPAPLGPCRDRLVADRPGGRAHVVGLSLGGSVALELLATLALATTAGCERAEARKKSMGLTPRDVKAIKEAVPHVAMVAPKAKLDAYKELIRTRLDRMTASPRRYGYQRRRRQSSAPTSC